MPPPSTPRTRPAKAALSLDAVVTATLAVVDEVGFEAASMRRIAQALETGPASLYVYVADRHELMSLAYDRVLGGIELPAASDGTWRVRLELLVSRMVTALATHGVAAVALNDVPTGPASLRVGDAMVGLLREGGIDDAQAAWGVDLLAQFVVSSALEEAGWHRAQRARAATDPDGATPEVMSSEVVGRLDAVYSALDRHDYPSLHAVRHLLTGGPADARATWKLRILVDGLLAQG